MRHRGLITVALLVAVFAPCVASAADKEGTVRSVDKAERAIVLDDGTKIWLADAVAIDALREGARVKLSYEEKDGKPVATSIEVK